MQRNENGSVTLTDPEQIVGDFYSYLRDDRGMSPEQAYGFLWQLPWQVLTRQFLEYLEEGRDSVLPDPAHFPPVQYREVRVDGPVTWNDEQLLPGEDTVSEVAAIADAETPPFI
jgi:hypothetical protein